MCRMYSVTIQCWFDDKDYEAAKKFLQTSIEKSTGIENITHTMQLWEGYMHEGLFRPISGSPVRV